MYMYIFLYVSIEAKSGHANGYARVWIAGLLGPQAFSIVMNAHDAVQAALSLNADMLRTLQPQMCYLIVLICSYRFHYK